MFEQLSLSLASEAFPCAFAFALAAILTGKRTRRWAVQAPAFVTTVVGMGVFRLAVPLERGWLEFFGPPLVLSVISILVLDAVVPRPEQEGTDST